MKEIGGYLEFENLVKNEYYKDLYAFNSARNCLRYIIKNRNITKIYLPFFCCESVYDACKKEKVDIVYYNIDKKFLPIIDKNIVFSSNCFLYIINYYGLLTNDILLNLKDKYNYIIIDNTHSFFQKPLDNIDTIYNCRKYFGVPDGAYLSSNIIINNNIQEGSSMNRFTHLIGRFEKSASDYYDDYLIADESFNDDDIKLMSKITKNLMGAIDYEYVKNIRDNNFNFLKKELKKYNKLDLKDKKLDFMYPLYLENANLLRKELIKNKIYVPILWPNVLKNEKNNIEFDFVKNIIPLPIDQRYSIEDMKYICVIVKEYLK